MMKLSKVNLLPKNKYYSTNFGFNEHCPANDYINLLVAPRQELFPSQDGLDILLEKRLCGVTRQGNVIWEIQDEIIQ
jgi:hypothetical protein